MTPRFICPHCHSSVAQSAMEIASSAEAQYRICPECDEPIVLLVAAEHANQAPSMTVAAEGCLL